MSNFIKVKTIKKIYFGEASHGEIIDLNQHSSGGHTNWVNPIMTLSFKVIELEGNSKRLFLRAIDQGNGVFKIIACASTTTDITKIEDSGVSTKHGTVVFFAIEE